MRRRDLGRILQSLAGQSETNEERAEMSVSEPDADALRSILGALPGVVLLVGEDRRIRFINKAAAGQGPDAFVGADAFEVLAPENRVDAVAAMDRVFETAEPTKHVAELVRPDGVHEWFESAVVPIVHDGRVTSVVIASVNVTERVKAERELEMIQTLLPLCSWCRKIRTGEDEWQSLEAYLEDVSDSRVTHGMCPDCEARLTNGDDRQRA